MTAITSRFSQRATIAVIDLLMMIKLNAMEIEMKTGVAASVHGSEIRLLSDGELDEVNGGLLPAIGAGVAIGLGLAGLFIAGEKFGEWLSEKLDQPATFELPEGVGLGA